MIADFSYLTRTTNAVITGEVHKAETDDGWHGVVREGGEFAPERDRYHLYIGLFCPFAHRANLVRHLRGLADIISLSVLKPYPKGNDKGWPGWQFPTEESEYAGATVDHLFGSTYLHEVYFKADPAYKGRYTVPLLWDKKRATIVSNESAEMLRWLPAAFRSLVSEGDLTEPAKANLYPIDLVAQIEAITVWMNRDLNSGVYKAGFAPDQSVYDKSVVPVFGALNALEKILGRNGGPYIMGKHFTELDIRAYATVIRFDPIYVQHFKCNLGTVRKEYPILNTWLRNLYWNVPGFKETTDFRHIKENYTKSHYDINPKAITPMGPWPDVEGGEELELEFDKMQVGGVTMPAVQEHASNLLSSAE